MRNAAPVLGTMDKNKGRQICGAELLTVRGTTSAKSSLVSCGFGAPWGWICINVAHFARRVAFYKYNLAKENDVQLDNHVTMSFEWKM